MRTTVRLDDELMTRVKRYALDHGRTLTAVIEESLQMLLTRTEQVQAEPRVEVIVNHGGSLRPGIDLSDKNTWWHTIEDEDIERFRRVTDAAG